MWRRVTTRNLLLLYWSVWLLHEKEAGLISEKLRVIIVESVLENSRWCFLFGSCFHNNTSWKGSFGNDLFTQHENIRLWCCFYNQTPLTLTCSNSCFPRRHATRVWAFFTSSIVGAVLKNFPFRWLYCCHGNRALEDLWLVICLIGHWVTCFVTNWL